MLNQGTLIGYVADVIREEKATLVVVEDRSGEKVRSSVARCWNDKTKAMAQDIAPGSLIKIDGYVSSNRSSQGRWFTDFNASFIKTLEAAPAMGAKLGKGDEGVAMAKAMFGGKGKDDLPF